MIKPGIEKDGNKSVLIGVFNSGYVIALLAIILIDDCEEAGAIFYERK